MSDATDPRANHLLASLDDADWRRYRPLMHCVHLKSGEVLHESGVAAQHVFFPTSAIAANLCLLRDGGSAEIAIIGSEGVVGMPLLLGGGSTPSRAVVLSAGHGIRIEARVLQDEFDHASPMTNLLLRYTQALLTQTAQTAVCNRFHSLTQQLCRWLLMSLDRMAGSEFVMTQELIATMLGVRRESVTEIAHRLQSEGLIRYTRGHIHVLDRQKLEQRSFECYAVVNKEYARLLRARPEAIPRPSERREAVPAD